MTSFLPAFTQILQDIAPPPVIPPNFKEFVGTYDMFNVTLTVIYFKL